MDGSHSEREGEKKTLVARIPCLEHHLAVWFAACQQMCANVVPVDLFFQGWRPALRKTPGGTFWRREKNFTKQ